MASGLSNPKKSRETFSRDPKRRPWKPGAQAPRTAVDDRASDDSSGRSFTGHGNGPNGYVVFENRVRIALDSCSKLDIRELRRRLTSELDQVRSLAKKLEASSKKDFGVGGFTQSQFSSNLESAAVRASSAAAAEKNKKKKKNPAKEPPKLPRECFSGQLRKSCSALLEKLMKHKFGWVFNAPVDFKALGLLDYRKIVKRPMDLGSVKARLSKGQYSSATDFAEDIRLTFHNAMLYNPKGQDVHSMAEKLLEIFEEKWAAIEPEKRGLDDENEVGLEWPRLDRTESVTKPRGFDPDPDPDPDPAGPPEGGFFGGKAGPVLKKPKAKEADKRDMTYEEKQRLSTSLQNLPSEKLDNVVQIIKKRNLGLCQQDDEIEVDIASIDPETLWELDRFVTNYKKGLSKNKRKAERALQSRVVDRNVAHKSSKTDSDSEGGSLGSGSAFRS